MMVKRNYLYLLIVAFVFALAACAAPAEEPTAEEEEAEEPTAVEEAAEEETDGEMVEEEMEEAEEEQVAQSDLTFCMVVHDDPTGSFWNVVDRGGKDAAAQYGINFTSIGSNDPNEQAQMIEDCASQGVDGLVVSMANPDALESSVIGAVDADIPVVTINSGLDRSAEFGALNHVGQTEFIAGQGAGLRFNEAGVSKVLCVQHEEGNVGLDERCGGLEDTFEGEVERFNVATTGVADIVGTLSTIQDKVTSDDSIDAILALNPDVGVAARDAVAAAGTEQIIGTFDLSPDVLEAIEAGEIIFAVDQQQYLQGYLPVVLLYLFNTNLNTVGGGQPLLTGPGFVTPDNAADVIELSAGGTR